MGLMHSVDFETTVSLEPELNQYAASEYAANSLVRTLGESRVESGTITAIELCTNNMQIAIAPLRNQSVYFAIAAAVAGATGALGTTIGGFLADNPAYGGLTGLFIISVDFRLLALIPLLFVQESRRQSLTQILQDIWQGRKQVA